MIHDSERGLSLNDTSLNPHTASSVAVALAGGERRRSLPTTSICTLVANPGAGSASPTHGVSMMQRVAAVACETFARQCWIRGIRPEEAFHETKGQNLYP